MKTHIEISIRLKLDGGRTLHDAFRQFARRTDGWKFIEKESKIYQKNIGGAGDYLVCDGVKGIKRGLVAIASKNLHNSESKSANNFYVANIVPRDCFHLTIDQYNAIGLVFARSFGSWLRKSSFNGIVRCSNPDKTLADIIPAAKCREFFKRYLGCKIWGSTSLPAHPSDIQNLDVFICALFRYGANVHTDEIERFLIADQKWKPEDAAWVGRRIETGLAVLRMARKF
jgi:hypothetical protein